jgi:hypothetical protein
VSEQRTKDQDYAYCRKYPGCGCFVGCVEVAWEDLAMREANRTSEQLCPCGCGWSVEGHKLWAEAKAREQPPSNPKLAVLVSNVAECLDYGMSPAECAKELRLIAAQMGYRTADETPACRYPDCVDNGPDGKCTDWLIGKCKGPTDVATACPPPAQMTSGEYLCPKCGYFHPPPDGDADVT